MATDDDLRRSRSRLIAAFRDASFGATPQTLSVQRVIELAAATRPEFHAHFGGIHDLAVAALVEEIDVGSTIYFTARVENRLTGQKISENAMTDVLSFIDERRSIYRETLTGTSTFAFAGAVEEALVVHARDYLRADQRATVHPEVAARMFGSGVLGVLQWWLREEPDISRDQLAREISRVVPPDFTA
jgi:hypothetical protein